MNTDWPGWYDKWCQRHGAIFGMTGADHVSMFAYWWTIFQPAGYSELELHGATNAIAAQTEALSWRDKHLAAINKYIADLRTAAAEKRFDEIKNMDKDPKRTWCELCKDTGQVIVPHPKFIIDGIWIQRGNSRPTCSVLCTCLRGKKIHDFQAAKGMVNLQLELSQYESKFSRNLWRSWFVEKSGLEAQTIRVIEQTAFIDKKLGPLPVGKLLTAAANGTAGDLLESAKRTRTPDSTRVDPPRTEAVKPVADDIRNKCPV